MNDFQDFDTYQTWTRETAIYSRSVYPRLALAEEVGELLGKLAKFERDVADKPQCLEDYQVEYAAMCDAVKKEAGDVMWQLARVLDDLGISMAAAVRGNVVKLESRKQRDVLRGSGDDR